MLGIGPQGFGGFGGGFGGFDASDFGGFGDIFSNIFGGGDWDRTSDTTGMNRML